MTRTLQPALAADPTLADAATRAFGDLAAGWFARGGPAGEDAGPRRELLLRTLGELGFAEALPSPRAREHWPDAAVLLRAQARAALPVDLALLFATGERAASIGYDPQSHDSGELPVPAEPAAAAALALGRCLQVGAATAAALELSLGYVRDRKQFGRPLAQFQAIQHALAIAAEEVAACNAIADLALARMAREGADAATLPALLDAAALVAGRAVDVVHDACHQVHGAIGFTREYALHRHSLDLLRWRDHLLALRGGELRCAERLGDAALAAEGLWRAVTASMKPGEPHG